MKNLEASDILQLYTDAETADQELFAEQRSNLLLIAGEHYTKKGSKFWNRITNDRNVNSEQKVRLTKNHIKKITNMITNSITTYSPGATVEPKHEAELKDIKDAQLNESVWEDLKARKNLKARINSWAGDFVGIGEAAVKIFWNPFSGRIVGYKPEVDEDGQPIMGEDGQPEKSETPVYAGDLEYETVYGFNLLRHRDAKSMESSTFMAIRKMVDNKQLKAMIDDKELAKKIQETPDETYIVFDNSQSGYKVAKDQTMLLEFYFRPCMEYPKGYFWIGTKTEKIWDGELPFGIFPIVYCGWDEIQTNPRARSVVKQLRPYQVEINRSASKIAEQQITLGDDKIVITNGSKMTQAGVLPGVRGINVSGMPPTILPGRSGDQYLGYMQAQITEMYDVANVPEHKQEKALQLDPYALLYRSLKEKKDFTLYSDKFETFLCQVCETSLEYTKQYYTPDHLIPAIGKREYVNIAEFKNTDKLCYTVTIEPQTNDIDTRMGKQLAFNHILQYASSSLDKDSIGKIIRNMPYTNNEECFDDLTMNYDVANNYILALDRGEQPNPNPYDDHVYLVKRFTKRMRESDFQMLPPNVQQNYQKAMQTHQALENQRLIQLKQAESEFIPTGGYLVACDFYVPDAKHPDKLPKRVRIPSEALQWLLKQMESQGTTQGELSNMNEGAQAQMAGQFMQMLHQANGTGPQQMGQPGAMSPQAPQPRPMPQMGPTSPQGAMNVR